MSPPRFTNPSNSSPAKADAYAALRVSGFRSYLCGNILATIGMQMLAVAVGWELYDTTNSATVLGLAGFCHVLPILVLAIPAGRVVDHFDRKKLLLLDQLLLALSAGALALATLGQAQVANAGILQWANGVLADIAGFFHDKNTQFNSPYVPLMLALLFFNGVVRSINQPVKQALIPQLVPAGIFSNAVTWNTTVVESSTIIGPAAAGLILAVLQSRYPQSTTSYGVVYFLAALGQLGQWLFLLPVRVAPVERHAEPFTVKSTFAGVAYVRRHEIILGMITLDLFSVLFGGVTALLPMYAKDILHCGPAGLGWLRATPALGACTVAILLAHLPPIQRAGRTLLLAVGGFGLATIAFGVSENFYLSLACLFLVGACNNTSVIIRQTLVQVLTPDAMRGRVSAVKSLFSSASNGLGDLRAGLMAASMGPVGSVVAGGFGVIFVVCGVASLWPRVRQYGALHQEDLALAGAPMLPENVIATNDADPATLLQREPAKASVMNGTTG
jgi:MFS family permease